MTYGLSVTYVEIIYDQRNKKINKICRCLSIYINQIYFTEIYKLVLGLETMDEQAFSMYF